MNLRQASQYLGVSPDTLYRYICDGEVPAFKLGSRWKFRKTVLDRWMEQKMRRIRTSRTAIARAKAAAGTAGERRQNVR